MCRFLVHTSIWSSIDLDLVTACISLLICRSALRIWSRASLFCAPARKALTSCLYSMISLCAVFGPGSCENSDNMSTSSNSTIISSPVGFLTGANSLSGCAPRLLLLCPRLLLLCPRHWFCLFPFCHRVPRDCLRAPQKQDCCCVESRHQPQDWQVVQRVSFPHDVIRKCFGTADP